MAYTGKKPTDHTDVTQSQSMTVTDDLTVDTDTLHVGSTNNNVGIGTSSPTVSGNAFTTLNVKGNASNTGLITVTSNDLGSSVQLYSGTSSSDNPAIAFQNDLRFGSATDAGVGGFSERMRLNSSGNVNIGDATGSGDKVFVLGKVRASSGFKMDGGTEIIPAASETMGFKTSGSERMRLNSSGNLLIGHTAEDINNNMILLRGNGSMFSSINSGNSYHLYHGSGAAYKFYVNVNGGISNFSANNINLSDQREKKNITDAGDAWADIKDFSIKEFHYNFEDDADPKKIGVIAQDVQQINADLISTFDVDDNTQRLAVKEQQITWMAIKALQEAIAKIETLETENADFETRIAALEAN